MKNWFVYIGGVFMPLGDATALGCIGLLFVMPIAMVFGLANLAEIVSRVAPEGKSAPLEDRQVVAAVAFFATGVSLILLAVFAAFGFCILDPELCTNIQHYIKGF